MNNPIVSVIVPVYKTQKYLDKCIESIISQTYSNLEIILIDDGSPDNCPLICDEWAKRDDRIRVIHKKNGGVSAARNTAIDVMNGEYVTFVDSDDWIDDDLIENLLLLCEGHNADAAISDFYFESADGTAETLKTEFAVYNNDEIVTNYLLDKIRPEACAKLIKSKLLADGVRFDCELKYGEDLKFNYEILKKADKICLSGECKYHYLQNSGSSSTTPVMTDARAVYWKSLIEIAEEQRGSKVNFDAAIWRFTVSVFAVLSRVLQVKEFREKYYDIIADAVINYKSDILANPYLSKKHKFMVIFLTISRKLFYHSYLIIRRFI